MSINRLPFTIHHAFSVFHVQGGAAEQITDNGSCTENSKQIMDN